MTHVFAKRGKIVSNAEFARLWADGSLSLAQIGARLGIGKSSVHSRAQRRGMPPRPSGNKTRLRDPALFARMFAAYVDGAEMGAHFGVDRKCIYKWAQRLGLTRQRGVPRITRREFAEMELAARMAASVQRRAA